MANAEVFANVAGDAIAIYAIGSEPDFDNSVITNPCLSTRGIMWGVGHAYAPLSPVFLFPSVQTTKINDKSTRAEELWRFFY